MSVNGGLVHMCINSSTTSYTSTEANLIRTFQQFSRKVIQSLIAVQYRRLEMTEKSDPIHGNAPQRMEVHMHTPAVTEVTGLC